MAQIFTPLVLLFRNHKLKGLSVLVVTCMCMIWLFPNKDLGDFITAQLARNTGIYLQFDTLSFTLFPSPGVEFNSPLLEPKGLPQLKAEQIAAYSSPLRLLGLKLGFEAAAKHLFKGDIDLSYAQGATTKSGQPADEITLHGDGISLDSVCDYLRRAGVLPVRVEGGLKIDSHLHVDHLFSEQPSGTLTLELPGFHLPSQTIMVDFNGVPVPQQIPALELGRVSIRNAKLENGVVDLQDVSVGDAKSEVNGKIKGTIGVQFRKDPNGARPELNAIDLAMDLVVDKGFMERNQKTVIGGFMILIPQNLKQETAKGTRLALRMKVGKPGEVPNFSPLTEKL